MRKVLYYSLVIVLVIILGVVVGVKFAKNEKTQPVDSEQNVEINFENNIENKFENIINNKSENTNNIGNIIEKTEEGEQKDAIANPKTDLERAIEIVKQDWGEDASVYFAQDGQTANGEYIICVRDNNTTSALAWYTVDIADETFVKE